MQDVSELIVLSTSDYYCPTEILEGMIDCGGKTVEIPKKYPVQGAWGQCSFVNQKQEILPSLTEKIHVKLVYISIVESKAYSLDIDIKKSTLRNDNTNKITLLIGLAPYGGVAVWQINEKRSYILTYAHADSADDCITREYVRFNKNSINDICKKYINEDIILRNHIQNIGVPAHSLFDNYMKQFTYRYQVIYNHWDEDEESWIKYDEEEDKTIPEFEYIEESLYDGTHDKLHDGGLMKYHEAGKPKKLALKWHIKKSEYAAYLWFENEEICTIFNKFYGQHPETKTDFIVHIDPIKKKYELSLYRYGLKEPFIIPETAYQLIVFKSGFENYRSDNYNQPTGAWVW